MTVKKILEGIKYTFMNIIKIHDCYKWTLDEDVGVEYPDEHVYCDNGWVSIDQGHMIIRKGYSWDGCSPKFTILGVLRIGIPDGIIDSRTGKQSCYYASLYHDALYQFKIGKRSIADTMFLEVMKKANFPLAYVYWFLVRSISWFFWKRNG